MKRTIGKTCAECPANCCIFGTGDRVLKVKKFLEGYMTTDSVNSRCENLTPQKTCRLWGTPKLPVECRVHVCHNRHFSEEEIAKIDSICDDVECANCKTKWLVNHRKNFRTDIWECEVCGEVYVWNVTVTKGVKVKKNG